MGGSANAGRREEEGALSRVVGREEDGSPPWEGSQRVTEQRPTRPCSGHVMDGGAAHTH